MSFHDGRPAPSRASRDAPTPVLIRGLVALPPLPRRSQEVLGLLCDPDLDILRLVELIEQTPVLAARILGVATSPFFRHGAPARDISDAIIRLLGLNLARDLSLSLILSQPFRVSGCARFDPMRYWRHAMMSATLAQTLAPGVSVEAAPTPPEAYLGGLLHSLGLLALVHVAPDRMDLAFERVELDPTRSLSEVQGEILGMDHSRAGAEIGAAWRLPPAITAAMAHHRDPSYRGPSWPLVALISLADCVSRDGAPEGRADLCAEELAGLLADLGIGPDRWDRTIQRWQARVEDIDQLAAVFASSGP